MVIALGVAWILDGLEITIAGDVADILEKKNTLDVSARTVGDIASALGVAAEEKSLEDIATPLSVVGNMSVGGIMTGVRPASPCRAARIRLPATQVTMNV